MTVFVPFDSNLDSVAPGPALTGIETHLTCVKVMEKKYAPTVSIVESQASSRILPAVSSLVTLAGLFAWCFAHVWIF